jgi:acyl-CoA synthetase (AMP-forming)/AMP-acid ligase II
MTDERKPIEQRLTKQTPIKLGDQMTIRGTIVDVVARCGGRVFLVDAATGREITYGDFYRQACALAAELRRRGIRKGDRVAVMVPNCCELAVFYSPAFISAP